MFGRQTLALIASLGILGTANALPAHAQGPLDPKCVLDALLSPHDPVAEPEETWNSLLERSRSADGKSFRADFPLLEAKEPVELAITTARRMRSDELSKDPDAKVGRWDTLLKKLERLGPEDYPYLDSISALSDFSGLMANETVPSAGTFERMFGVESNSARPYPYFAVPVSRALSKLDFIRASPYPIFYVGLSTKMQYVDQTWMSPRRFWDHDFQHGWEAYQKRRFGPDWPKNFPIWKANIDRLLKDLSEVRDPSLRTQIIDRAFDILHEQSHPPSFAEYGTDRRVNMMDAAGTWIKERWP